MTDSFKKLKHDLVYLQIGYGNFKPKLLSLFSIHIENGIIWKHKH